MSAEFDIVRNEFGKAFEVAVTDRNSDRALHSYTIIPAAIVDNPNVTKRALLSMLVGELNGCMFGIDAHRKGRPEVGLVATGPDGQQGHITMVDRTSMTVAINGGSPVPWAECSYGDR